MSEPLDLDLSRMLVARDLIDPAFLDTPVLTDGGLNAALGCSVFVKDETRNPIGSFKGRGAEFFAATVLRPRDVAVAASAGNFGQGLTWAAGRRGYACVVFAATTANPVKVKAMRRLGAELHLVGRDLDEAKLAARAFAAAHGHRFVEDGAEPAIAEGAGTIGLELASSVPALDLVTVPLGNGALLAGVGAAMRHRAPRAKVIGVVAETAPAMRDSLAAGLAIATYAADTIADGLAVRLPVPQALDMLKDRYDDVVGVSEDQLREAIRLVERHLGVVAEPAGIAGIAAILAAPARYKGRRVGTMLCGANIAPDLRRELFGV